MARTTLVSCYVTILHYCPCTGCFQPAALTLTHFELTTLPLVVPFTSQVCSLSPPPAVSSSILAASLSSMPNLDTSSKDNLFTSCVWGFYQQFFWWVCAVPFVADVAPSSGMLVFRIRALEVGIVSLASLDAF